VTEGLEKVTEGLEKVAERLHLRADGSIDAAANEAARRSVLALCVRLNSILFCR